MTEANGKANMGSSIRERLSTIKKKNLSSRNLEQYKQETPVKGNRLTKMDKIIELDEENIKNSPLKNEPISPKKTKLVSNNEISPAN